MTRIELAYSVWDMLPAKIRSRVSREDIVKIIKELLFTIMESTCMGEVIAVDDFGTIQCVPVEGRAKRGVDGGIYREEQVMRVKIKSSKRWRDIYKACGGNIKWKNLDISSEKLRTKNYRKREVKE